VKSRRLRVETAVIVKLARRLTGKLQAGDPLASRVKLTKPDFFAATVAALPGLL
jgi:farnesyl-diphosphate farnesyltransferase